MGELIGFGAFVYSVTTFCAVTYLLIIHSDYPRAHWTLPFAGLLWPLLAVIAIWIAWSRRND